MKAVMQEKKMTCNSKFKESVAKHFKSFKGKAFLTLLGGESF
jgi:hypothetical protein